jgi:peptidoglycan/xylan/chitin deacetylase (PgdA/CDA1 family)
MRAPRLSVALTVDHDAISDSIRLGDPPVKLSHGEFGHRVGVKRLLALLERRAMPATFFVPGHTLTTFTDDTDAILAGGHELACHGWMHEDLAELTAEEQRDIVGRSIEAVRAVTGAAPAGFRAPYWSFGEETLGLVAAAGFVYDSSLMADDYNLYRPRVGDRHSATDGTTWGAESSLVEVPVYWAMDDWPHFEAGSGRPRLSAPSAVLEIWTEELRYAHQHAPGGLLVVTVHPECIGRGHRMAMLERFLDAAAALDGVVFERLDTVVDRWLAASR